MRLTRAGLEVYAGFIVGFDSDGEHIFEAQRAFISALPIAAAMIGLLTALPNTALWRRLEKEGRLRSSSTGDQFGRPNFDPVLDERTLLEGYRQLLADIYHPAAFYARVEAGVRDLGRGKARALDRCAADARSRPDRRRRALAAAVPLLAPVLQVHHPAVCVLEGDVDGGPGRAPHPLHLRGRAAADRPGARGARHAGGPANCRDGGARLSGVKRRAGRTGATSSRSFRRGDRARPAARAPLRARQPCGVSRSPPCPAC